MNKTDIAIQKHKELLSQRGYKKSLILLVQEVLADTEINMDSENIYSIESQLALTTGFIRNSSKEELPIHVGSALMQLIQLCKKHDLDIRDCLELVVDSDE